jgi:hypothetical protein
LGAAHENALKDSQTVDMMAEEVRLGAAHENTLKNSHPVNMMAEEVSDWVLLIQMH